MNDNTIEKAFWVVVENGRLFMYDPNGNSIYGEIFCRIHDGAMGESPKAFFSVLVNIAGSVDEMNERIKKHRQQ